VGNVTVIGVQWSDEGKGKIVDWLASRADMIVRFQGVQKRSARAWKNLSATMSLPLNS
jgi:hypothetical protein